MGISNNITAPRLTPKSLQQQSRPSSEPNAVTTAILSILETRVIDVLPTLGFLFLTYNVVDALFKANDDYGTISFVVCSYLNLIALFCCLKSLHKLPEDESSKKTRLKFITWILAASLKLFFSYRVTSILLSIVIPMTMKDQLSFVFDDVPPVIEELTAPTSQPQDEIIEGRGRRGGFATEIKNSSGGATRRVALFLLATSLALFVSSSTGREAPTYAEAVRYLFNVVAFFSSVVLAIFTVYNQ